MHEVETRAVAAALERAWESYYSLGETADLPNHFAMLLFTLREHEAALRFLERSARLHGEKIAGLINMAKCQLACGRRISARRLLRRVLAKNPGHEAATTLLAATDSM